MVQGTHCDTSDTSDLTHIVQHVSLGTVALDGAVTKAIIACRLQWGLVNYRG